MRIEPIIMPVLRATAKRDWASKIADRVLRPWNPFTPSRYSDPYPLYETIRRSGGPISYQRTLQGWNVVGYDACEEALRNPNMSVDRSDLLSIVRPYSKLDVSTRDLFLSTMLMQDPPDHTRLRTLVNRAFTPRRIAALEPNVERITRELLHTIETEHRTDAMESFCNRLPIQLISDMLGLPRSDWAEFQQLSDELVKFVDPISAFDAAEMTAAVHRFRTMVGDLVTEREAEPRDDMVSRLIAASDDGDRLSRSELESMVAILMVAGHETTASLLGNSLLALQQHPQARDQLRSEPQIIENAVEELLRFDSPVQQTDRFVTADVEIAGRHIKSGQLLGIFLAAANRDPARYDQADVLILDRPDPRPLSFGHGIHHCLEAALARIEAWVALPLFLDAFPDYRIDIDQVAWKRSVTVRGPRRLPMALQAGVRHVG